MKKNYKASPDPEAVLHNLMQAHHGATAGNPAYEIVRVIGNYLSLLNRQPGFREGELRQMAQAGLDRALDMLRDATTRAVLDSDTHFLSLWRRRLKTLTRTNLKLGTLQRVRLIPRDGTS